MTRNLRYDYSRFGGRCIYFRYKLMLDGVGVNITNVLHLKNKGVACGILFIGPYVISRGKRKIVNDENVSGILQDAILDL